MVEEASSDLVAVWEIHLADGIHMIEVFDEIFTIDFTITNDRVRARHDQWQESRPDQPAGNTQERMDV